NFTPVRGEGPIDRARRVLANLGDRPLVGMYLIAFLLMGGFVATYNYLAFHLVGEPYLLPAWAIGLTFLAYLAGTVSAPRAGALAARHGRYRVIVAMVLVMLAGLLVTLARPLWLVLLGVVVLTAGFFGAHSVASGWAGARAISRSEERRVGKESSAESAQYDEEKEKPSSADEGTYDDARRTGAIRLSRK